MLFLRNPQFAVIWVSGILFPLLASAAVPVYDRQGMPRCIHPMGNPPAPGKGLVLRFVGDVHNKLIQTTLIEETPASPLMWEPEKLTCADWGWFETYSEKVTWTDLSEGQASVGEYVLDDETLRRLAQVRLGSKLFHSEMTAREFLNQNPIKEFDRTVNRVLTRKYGIGFTSAIYKAWENQRPETRLFTQSVSMNIEKVEQEAQASSISARYKNHRILIANGIGNDPKKGRMQAILRDFEAMGADSELLMTDAYGTLLENSQLLENQIDTFLAKGQNLILVGTSKSIVELIGALARLAPKLEGNERPPGYGKIEALVSISGLMQGSVLADWLDRQWGTNLFNGVVNLLAKLSDQYSLKAISSYRIMNSHSLTEWYQEYAPRIPKSVLYVNLIGITPGDGIAKDSFLNQLQTYLVRPAILDYGAYDGYVEYPGSSMPNEWAPKIVRLTVDSSHSLLDGSFRDLPLDQESSRRTFFAGLFHSIADLAW